MNANPKVSSLQVYLRLLTYLKGLVWPFALSITGFLVFAASQPMMAKVMEMIITAIESKNEASRWSLPLIAVGVFVIRGVGMFLGTYYNDFVGASVVRNLKYEIFQHMVALPASFFDSVTQGQLLHRLNSGVGQIQTAVTNALKTIIREGMTIVALLGYVFYLNWKLSLVFLMVAPLLAIMVTYTTRRFRKIARRGEKSLGQAMQVSKETMSNYGVVRGFGAQEYEKARYLSAIDGAFNSQLKIRRLQAIFSPMSQVVISMAVAGIIFLLLEPSILASYTTGELVGYLTAVALIPKPLRQMSGVSVVIQRGVVGAELVFGILDEPAEVDNGTYEVDSVRGDIAVKNLHFRYPGTEKEVLKGISLNVKPGEMVALVGRSGSGKSTLVSLLYRLYNVADNAIFLDGVNINDFKLTNLRSHIATVNQNIALFDDTIRNNVAYGDVQYTDEEIVSALQGANAWDFVSELPAGINTVVGENGLKLSGGQRQRISIARAFLKTSSVLILDEATSALDNESEAAVTKAIDNLARNKTTIVIAHRLSTILKSDRLLVLDEGEIVEQGTHAELLAKGGYYADLYNAEYMNQQKV